MTKEQITEYEYCKNHLSWIEEWKKKIPFGVQVYGQGSGVPNIEHQLSHIHKEMNEEVNSAIIKAKNTIKSIIEDV